MAWRRPWWRFKIQSSNKELRSRQFCTGFLQGKSALQTVTSSGLIPFCNSEQDLEEARRLHEQMKEQGINPSPSCYQTLLDGYSRFGSPQETQALIDDMKQTGLVPDVRAYSSLITSYIKANSVDDAFRIFQRLRDDKMELGANMYSTMVWLLCQANRPKDGELVLQMLAEDQKVTDSISYNVVISAYERAGCYSDAIRMFKGVKKPPGQTTYIVALNAYLKTGELESFNRLFTEMVTSGMFGNASILEAAINFYASTNRFADAEWLYKQLSRSSLHLSLRGYNKLMELFTNAGNFAMVDRIHREMGRVTAPDATSRRWLLTAYLKAQSFKAAIELYEEILRESDHPQLDQTTFQLLVRAFVNAHRFFEAMKVAVQMRKAGMSLDEELYNAVVNGMLSVDKPSFVH